MTVTSGTQGRCQEEQATMCSDAPQLMASTAAHCTDERSNPVDQYKVAQVIGTELHLEAVNRSAKGGCHHARVGDNNIEGFSLRQELISARSHALKLSRVKVNSFEFPP